MENFCAPKTPPKTEYRIDASVERSEPFPTVRGSEAIRIKNSSSRAIPCLAFDWPIDRSHQFAVTVGGELLHPAGASPRADVAAPTVFRLPDPLSVGQALEIHIEFTSSPEPPAGHTDVHLVDWHPRLYWGFPTCDDFDVKIEAPADIVFVTSAPVDPDSGRYLAQGIRTFGLVGGSDLEALKTHSGDVEITCLAESGGEECARLLLATAEDAIDFYRERFGFYPHKSLSIVPGVDRPMGGYPVATAIVVVHGQKQLAKCSELHWKWITAHEIGHQYWGEYVMGAGSLDSGCLMLGVGIYADREYVRARKLGDDKHHALAKRYVDGVLAGFDTTVDLTDEQYDRVEFDFNNVVYHGKGFCIISALDCIVGGETLGRISNRCLREFGGVQMSAADFRRVCEDESDMALGWFFSQWVRSNRRLCYEIANQTCNVEGGGYVTRVEVERTGSLSMPVPVVATFVDGSTVRSFTDRLLETQVVEFRSDAPPRHVQLDPEGELSMVPGKGEE